MGDGWRLLMDPDREPDGRREAAFVVGLGKIGRGCCGCSASNLLVGFEPSEVERCKLAGGWICEVDIRRTPPAASFARATDEALR